MTASRILASIASWANPHHSFSFFGKINVSRWGFHCFFTSFIFLLHSRFIIPQFTSRLKVSHFISSYLYRYQHRRMHRNLCFCQLSIVVCLCQTCSFCHLFFFFLFTFTVELNEIGFKFVRKCINYIETNGKGPDWKFMPAFFSSVSCPVGGVVEALDILFDAPPADCSQGKNTLSTQVKLNIIVCFTSEEALIITSLHTLKAQPILFKVMIL